MGQHQRVGVLACWCGGLLDCWCNKFPHVWRVESVLFTLIAPSHAAPHGSGTRIVAQHGLGARIPGADRIGRAKSVAVAAAAAQNIRTYSLRKTVESVLFTFSTLEAAEQNLHRLGPTRGPTDRGFLSQKSGPRRAIRANPVDMDRPYGVHLRCRRPRLRPARGWRPRPPRP